MAKPRPAMWRREGWERRWSGDPASFVWYLTEPPPELIRLLQDDTDATGPVLDIGCGDGVLTRFIAERRSPVVGVDIATRAIRRAVATAGDRAAFVVGAAPETPIASGAMGFVFDRGCLQQLPYELWPAYFADITRMLRPGGTLLLYCTKQYRLGPGGFRRFPLGWVRRALINLRRPQRRARRLIERLGAERLEVLDVGDFERASTNGMVRAVTRGLFRKR